MKKNLKFLITTFCAFALTIVTNKIVWFSIAAILCYNSFTQIFAGIFSIKKRDAEHLLKTKVINTISYLQIFIGILVIAFIFLIYFLHFKTFH